MSDVLLEAENLRVEADSGAVVCRVWSAPALSPEAAAARGAEMVELLRERVVTRGSPYRGVVLDVSAAPAAYGPKTRETLEAMFTAAGEAGVPVAVVLGPQGVQRLQFTALTQRAGRFATLVDDEQAALTFLGEKPTAGRF